MSKKTRQQKKLQRQQKEQLQFEQINAANAQATAAIKAFLKVPPAYKSLDNTAWHLHVLCRVGDSVGAARYEAFELEAYKSFMEKLTLFFLQSDNANRFNQLIENQNELGERLFLLTDYFNSLIYSTHSKAELDLIDTDHFGSLDLEECKRIVWTYNREERLMRAKTAAFFTPKERQAA